jgi:hypothetical protein
METKEHSKSIPLDYIRGLIVAQEAKCAITGFPLDPLEVNADHVIPLSREELAPSRQADNIWLVHKKINAMKGTMTYEELVNACRAVLDHHSASVTLLKRIQHGEIKPLSKHSFDSWVEANCDESGKLKSEQAGTGQPATRPVAEPEVGDNPQPESEGRSR